VSKKLIKKAQVTPKKIKRKPLKKDHTKTLTRTKKVLQKTTKSITNATLTSNNKNHHHKKLTL